MFRLNPGPSSMKDNVTKTVSGVGCAMCTGGLAHPYGAPDNEPGQGPLAS